MDKNVLKKLIEHKREQVAELWSQEKCLEAWMASAELDELISMAMKLNMVEKEINLDDC